MPTVYGASASPFVRKVRVVLAEKGIAYDLDPVIPFNPPAEFRQISPLGKIPAYRDGDKVLADSSIICSYIDKTSGGPSLYPSDPYECARAMWFEEYADGGLVSVVGPKIFMQKVINPLFFGKPADEAIVKKAIDEELPPYFDYLESQLGSSPYLVANQFSIADIGVGSQFVNLKHAGVIVDAKRWPKLAKYVAGIFARPSFKALIDEESAQFPPAA